MYLMVSPKAIPLGHRPSNFGVPKVTGSSWLDTFRHALLIKHAFEVPNVVTHVALSSLCWILYSGRPLDSLLSSLIIKLTHTDFTPLLELASLFWKTHRWHEEI